MGFDSFFKGSNNICPKCGEKVKKEQEWTRVTNAEFGSIGLYHYDCVPLKAREERKKILCEMKERMLRGESITITKDSKFSISRLFVYTDRDY